MKNKKHKGLLVIISGPSGVGKGTICKEVVKAMDNIQLGVSVTTRAKSDIEIDGKDYWFISKEEFEHRIAEGRMLEYAEVFGNMYGSDAQQVEEALQQSQTIILEIDVQGARQVKIKYPDAVMIFILPPSHGELAKRINHRGREDAESAEKRLSQADNEIAAAWQYYQCMVINAELEQAVNEVMQIIETERKLENKND